jgi:hypothetical protein
MATEPRQGHRAECGQKQRRAGRHGTGATGVLVGEPDIGMKK